MIILREFQFDQDYDNVLKLWKNAGDGIGVGISDQPEELKKKLTRDPDLFLIAEDDGLLVGSVLGGYDGRRGMVYHLAVEASYRRKGLASQLMDEIETRLRGKGCRKAYLLVKKGNQAAYDFYAVRGWDEMEHVNIYGKTL